MSLIPQRMLFIARLLPSTFSSCIGCISPCNNGSLSEGGNDAMDIAVILADAMTLIMNEKLKISCIVNTFVIHDTTSYPLKMMPY